MYRKIKRYRAMLRDKNGSQPQFMQGILTVKEKVFLTPHYIQLVLEGKEVLHFAEAKVGDNNKLVIPIQKGTPIEFPRGKGNQSADTVIRTYTLRALDLEKQQMTIEFVAHGEEGPASKWAINANVGDLLGVMMKTKDKSLFLTADWYLLVGDHTALPVISVILEQLPPNAVGKAIIEVYGAEDVLPLKKPDGMEINWKFNSTPGENSALADFLEDDTLFIREHKFIFVAAEYSIAQQVQEGLRAKTNLERKEWQVYSYWKLGASEEMSASDRRPSRD